MSEQDELLLLLRQYNLPACSATEWTQVDEARRDFLAKAKPIIEKQIYEALTEEARKRLELLNCQRYQSQNSEEE